MLASELMERLAVLIMEYGDLDIQMDGDEIDIEYRPPKQIASREMN